MKEDKKVIVCHDFGNDTDADNIVNQFEADMNRLGYVVEIGPVPKKRNH